jgi:hypothetical protein
MSLLERLTTYWQDTLNLLLGTGLFFSPWLFGFEAEQPAAFSAHLIGALIAVMALLELFVFQAWEELVSGLLGAWLVISPWVFGFSGSEAATLTHVVAGIAAIVLAIWSASEHGAGHLTA